MYILFLVFSLTILVEVIILFVIGQKINSAELITDNAILNNTPIEMGIHIKTK